MNKDYANLSNFHKIQTTITHSRKRNADKSFIFHILRWTGFLMILLTTLYDDYIDRSKLSEHKNAVEYIVTPPSRGVGLNIKMFYN